MLSRHAACAFDWLTHVYVSLTNCCVYATQFGLPTPAESSELLATKMEYLISKGVNVILAIGEPLPIREKGDDAVLEYCAAQLTPCLPHLDASKVVIAYEPVWSIGTGVTACVRAGSDTSCGRVAMAHGERMHWTLKGWRLLRVPLQVAGAGPVDARPPA